VNYYNRFYEDAIKDIASDTYQTDNLIDSPSENRFGITLVLRPDIRVKNNMQQFLSELRIVEPEQYYYPDSDLHVTLLSIISCYPGFDLKNIPIAKYIDLIGQNLNEQNKIRINFNGLTASSSCIMARGFPVDDTIDGIRENLRKGLRESGLQQSADKRYVLQTAHSTLVRFRKKFARKEEFLKLLEKYRDFDFGTFTAEAIELVYNDWYQRKIFVKTLHKFLSA